MKKETIERFKNKKVRLVTNGHAIYGDITELKDDCVIFESENAVSAISLDAIDTIVLSNRKGDC